MAITYRYGIDLGTTNSSISVVEMGKDGRKKPNVFLVDYNNQPHEVIKSIVGFKGDEKIVGDDGMYSLEGTEDNPVRMIKMKLISEGRDKEIPAVPGQRYSDAMAAVLKKLKEAADEGLKNTDINPSGVVIGLPCELYNNNEPIKHAYCVALKKAGFYESLDEAKKLTVFLDEPCAVALFYGNQSLYQNKRTMIFDFGGGTLDLAIVDLKEQSLNDPLHSTAHKVVAKVSQYGAGELYTEILFREVFFPAFRDQHCDGSAWNVAKIFKKMGCRAMRAEDIYRELSDKAGSCWRFIHELEIAKARLSFDETYDFYFECNSVDGTEKVVFDTTELRREDFEKALIPEMHKIQEVINHRLFTPEQKRNGLTKDSVEKIILAGGSSSIPCVRKKLEELFPDKIMYDEKKQGPFFVNMMTCISQGLAIQGYYDDPSVAINNVTAYDYGIMNAYENKIEVIIPKNTNFADTDIDLSKKGLIPSTKYYLDVEQVNKSSRGFFIEIYENKTKILKLIFDKNRHSGFYRVFLKIDAGKGILVVKVYDKIEDKWVDDLKEEALEYTIRT